MEMMPTEVETVTREQLLEEAEELAQSALQVSREEAFQRLAQGQYRGTIFEAKMAAIRFLLDASGSSPGSSGA